MNTTELEYGKLFEKAEYTKQIIWSLHINIANLKDLQEALDKSEIHNRNKPFFELYKFQLHQIIVIDFCKLFVESKSHRQNFVSLLSELKNVDNEIKDCYLVSDGRAPAMFSNEDALHLFLTEMELEIKWQEDLIKRLQTLRDKVYAHRDNNSEIIFNLTLPVIDEYNTLKYLAKNIFESLYSPILKSSYDFNSWNYWSIDGVIKSMNHFKTESK